MRFFAQTYNYNFSPASDAASTDDMTYLWVFFAIFGIFTLLYVIPHTVTSWRLYKKAGEPGWANLVPLYSEWVSCKIAKAPEWLFIAIAILNYGFGWIPFVNIITSLPAMGVYIYLIILFSKQYDRGPGFWVLYMLLPVITMFTVSKAKYLGETKHTLQPAHASLATPMTLQHMPHKADSPKDLVR